MKESIQQLVEESRKNKETLYDLWLMVGPLWRKWAYKMSCLDYERKDWEQQSYLLLEEAIQYYKESYGISFTAYYRMILYRWGKKRMNKGESYLLPYESEKDLCSEQKDETIAIEEDFIEQEIREGHKRLVKDLLGKLTEEERFIIEAFYFKEQSVQAIARSHQTSYPAIECKKRRTLKKMKKIMLQHDGFIK